MRLLTGMLPQKHEPGHDEWGFYLYGIARLVWEDLTGKEGTGLTDEEFEEVLRAADRRYTRRLTAPLAKPEARSVMTQTAQLPDTSDDATDPPSTPPARTYAEVAVQAAPPKRKREQGGKEKERARQPPASPGKSGGRTVDPGSSEPCLHRELGGHRRLPKHP